METGSVFLPDVVGILLAIIISKSKYTSIILANVIMHGGVRCCDCSAQHSSKLDDEEEHKNNPALPILYVLTYDGHWEVAGRCMVSSLDVNQC